MQKDSIWDLAIFGCRPLFTTPLHVNRPNAGSRETFDRLVDGAWNNRMFTNNGPISSELEKQLADYLGVRNCVLTANGTLAMALVLQALGIRGEVILPSFTFVSTAHVLEWAGIRPVFCDIDRDTWTIDPDHCRRLVNDRTAAVIGTHTWGTACDVDALSNVCADADIFLLFDAAHAFGATRHGNRIGRFGDAEVFSFHATKAFHCFEGGAVTTQDDDLAEKLRQMRNFGFSGYDQVSLIGTNAKLSEIHAAMGLVNLDSFGHVVETSKSCWTAYKNGVDGINGLEFRDHTHGEHSNYHYVVTEVCEEEFGLDRDCVVDILHAENIFARRYFYPGVHAMQPYQTRYPEAGRDLDNTDRVSERVMVLPGGSSVTGKEVSETCELLAFVGANSRAINEALHSRKIRAV